MSNHVWRRAGVKRLGFAGARTEYLFAAALGAIIVLALGLTLYTTFVRPDKPEPVEELVFICAKPDCGHQFTVKTSELDPPQSDSARPNPMVRDMSSPFMTRDCPKCGTKNSAYIAVQCPNCEEYFLQKSMLLQARAYATGDMKLMEESQTTKDECPHCHTILQDWWATHRKSR